MSLATTSIFKQLQNNNPDLHKMSDKQLRRLQKILLEMMSDFDDVCKRNKINYGLGGGSCLGAVRHNGFIPWDDDVDLNIPRKDYEKLKKVFDKELGEKYYLQSIDTDKNYDLNVPKMRKRGTIYRTKDDLGKKEAGIGIDLCIIENTYNFTLARYLQGFLSLTLGLITSCRNFYANRKIYLKMADGNKKIRRAFKIKIFLGFLVAWNSCRGWSRLWDKINKMCKNEESKYVVVPVGRNHFFGELYRRKDFCITKEHIFEGKMFPVPKDYQRYLEHMYGDYMKIPEEGSRETHTFFEIDFGDYED